jgi:hypothetical protein
MILSYGARNDGVCRPDVCRPASFSFRLPIPSFRPAPLLPVRAGPREGMRRRVIDLRLCASCIVPHSLTEPMCAAGNVLFPPCLRFHVVGEA